jgi:hypothetical protein
MMRRLRAITVGDGAPSSPGWDLSEILPGFVRRFFVAIAPSAKRWVVRGLVLVVAMFAPMFINDPSTSPPTAPPGH